MAQLSISKVATFFAIGCCCCCCCCCGCCTIEENAATNWAVVVSFDGNGKLSFETGARDDCVVAVVAAPATGAGCLMMLLDATCLTIGATVVICGFVGSYPSTSGARCIRWEACCVASGTFADVS